MLYLSIYTYISRPMLRFPSNEDNVVFIYVNLITVLVKVIDIIPVQSQNFSSIIVIFYFSLHLVMVHFNMYISSYYIDYSW